MVDFQHIPHTTYIDEQSLYRRVKQAINNIGVTMCTIIRILYINKVPTSILLVLEKIVGMYSDEMTTVEMWQLALDGHS